MVTTDRARRGSSNGRVASELARRLGQEIARGRFKGGRFLPPERELARRHGVAKMTARRALKFLEREGLVVAEPRQGYRVLPRAADPDMGLPVAYLAYQPASPTVFWDEFHRTLVAEFQKVAAARGWSLLVVGSRVDNVAEVMDQLSSAGVCGAILDLDKPGYLEALGGAGVPAVVVDIWNEVMPADVDAVAQDGFRGGFQAAKHLAERGCRRIAWFGAEPVGGDLQIVERCFGALAALEGAGLKLCARARAPLGRPEEARGRARKLLAGRGRPDAVLCLWQEMTAALTAAARDLKLVPGRDFEMVGWSTAERYETGFLPNFAGGPAPAAVIWSVARMAETAVRCLKHRRADPGMPAVCLKIPTELRPGAKAGRS